MLNEDADDNDDNDDNNSDDENRIKSKLLRKD